VRYIASNSFVTGLKELIPNLTITFQTIQMPNQLIDLVYERQWSSLNNLIAALTETGQMGRLYGGFPKFRYERAGIPREILRTYPVASLWNHLALQCRLPAPLRLEEPRMVGNWVARHKDLAPVVMANGTAHRFLFPKLKGSGRTLILERGSMHPEDLFHFNQRARQEAGYSYSTALPAELIDEIEKNQLADYLIAGSEMIRESYVSRGFPADRAFTCRYGVDPERFPFIQRSAPVNRPIRIAAIGLVGFRKGLYRLLKLGEWTKRRDIPLEIHFAGPVFDMEAHVMIANSNATTHLHGVIKGAAFQDFLSNSDLCAVLSYEEGLPLAMLEAMSSGLPPIISTDTGAREVMEDGLEGVHLTDFTDEEFDSKLRGLLRSPRLLPIMGERARLKIKQGFDTRCYTKNLRTIIANITGSTSSESDI
jgi:starch synthase